MNIKNPQAFPIAETKYTDSIELGMTLRDYFANSAMQSIMVSEFYKNHKTPEQVAKGAYILADAMLKQREL
jgi:hypothetical protein